MIETSLGDVLGLPVDNWIAVGVALGIVAAALTFTIFGLSVLLRLVVSATCVAGLMIALVAHDLPAGARWTAAGAAATVLTFALLLAQPLWIDAIALLIPAIAFWGAIDHEGRPRPSSAPDPSQAAFEIKPPLVAAPHVKFVNDTNVVVLVVVKGKDDVETHRYQAHLASSVGPKAPHDPVELLILRDEGDKTPSAFATDLARAKAVHLLAAPKPKGG